jgi:polysaccharide chain length determinant protein (PEP-CTERM system associated)
MQRGEGDCVNQQFEKIQSLLRSAWRNRWQGLLAAWVVGAIGAVVIYAIPERYEASARIYVDTQTVLKPLMRDLAVQPDVELQVSMLARTLISRKNVETVIANLDFQSEMAASGGHDGLVDGLTKAIRLEVQGRNLYRITYKDVNPQRAEKLVANFVALFVDTGVGESRKDTEDARKFIDEQIKTYEAKLSESENRLKEFKMRNFGYAVGGAKGDQFGQMSTISEEVRKLRVDLRAAEQSRDSLRQQLASENPILSGPTEAALAAAQRPSEIESRLEVQQRQLDELLRRFTENHPDVIAARRLITQLEGMRRQEIENKRAAELAASKSNAPSNPVYQKIKISLAEAEAQVAALRARANDQQGRLDELRGAAIKVPKLEAELAQLNRDYDIVRKNYEQLVARRESAAISGKVDESAQLAVFRVVEPPRVAGKPSFPNRMTLIPLLLAAALAAGATVAAGLGQLIPTFDDLRTLREASKRPVLGSISKVGAGAVGLNGERLAFTAGVAALAAFHVLWLLWSGFGRSAG